MATTRYLEILARQRPFPFALDEHERVMFSCNFDALAAAPVAGYEEGLVAYLASGSLAALGTDAFIGRKAVIPAGAGPYVSIVDTGGRTPDRTHNQDIAERLSFQIVVRGLSHTAARDRALAIWRRLDGLRNVTIVA
jgi:hypothetical protein